MKITEIAEHSVCLDLLPKDAIILDLGCRGFEFSDYFTFKFRESQVFPVDIDELPGRNYHKVGISHEDGTCSIMHTPDPQGKYITEGYLLDKKTIKSFCKDNGIKRNPDLIKMDIEGEEAMILLQGEHPMAKQISVEFHAHCRPEQTKEDLDRLLSHLSQWYDIYNDKWESRHGAGFNYWDVLLIAK